MSCLPVSNVTVLEELESAFKSTYNSFIGCQTVYDNAFKIVGLSLVVSYNVTEKSFLMGTSIRSNALYFTCPEVVPALFSDLFDLFIDVGDVCSCNGPTESLMVSGMNVKLLRDSLFMTDPIILPTQVITGITQLCVGECTEDTEDVSYGDDVSLPCDIGIVDPVTDDGDPTPHPTMQPTKYPTKSPTDDGHPTPHPTKYPTRHPTRFPTRKPTRRPTKRPTKHPTKRPTKHPTKRPTRRPTPHPTPHPTHPPPTSPPTPNPTPDPTPDPTRAPTPDPTRAPTPRPSTAQPTAKKDPNRGTQTVEYKDVVSISTFCRVGQTDRVQVVYDSGEVKCYINKEGRGTIEFTLNGKVVKTITYFKQQSCGSQRSDVAPNHCNFRGIQTDENLP